MVDLKQLQKEIYQNKVDHGFNVTDLKEEFCYTYGELSEAYMAWFKGKDDYGEELADVAIFLLGISEISGVDLEKEIIHKMEKNTKRKYELRNGAPIKIEG